MLAIAIYYQFEYKLNLYKVIYMLAIHELEEIGIGDLAFFGIDEEELKTCANNYNKAKMKVTNWHYVDQGNSNTIYRLFCSGEIAAILYSIGS